MQYKYLYLGYILIIYKNVLKNKKNQDSSMALLHNSKITEYCSKS